MKKYDMIIVVKLFLSGRKKGDLVMEINPDYTFASFREDIYNQRAYNLAMDYAKNKHKEVLGIYGLPGTGKTRLLHAVANYWMVDKPKECIAFYPKGALKEKLEMARKDDRFLIKTKKEYKNTDIVCIDEINEMFHDDGIQKMYEKLFRWWSRQHIHIIFTEECTEKTYDIFSELANALGEDKLVGIAKPRQRRGESTAIMAQNY